MPGLLSNLLKKIIILWSRSKLQKLWHLEMRLSERRAHNAKPFSCAGKSRKRAVAIPVNSFFSKSL